MAFWIEESNRIFSYAPFTRAKLNPTAFVLLSVSSVVMEYFCLLFYRNFSLSISSFHLSYELFWIQGESQTSDWRRKGMRGWKKQGSWPGSCFFVVVCYFTLRICFVIIFVSPFVTGKKKRINGKSESSRKNSEFIAKRGSWKSPTANEWGMQSFKKERNAWDLCIEHTTRILR